MSAVILCSWGCGREAVSESKLECDDAYVGQPIQHLVGICREHALEAVVKPEVDPAKLRGLADAIVELVSGKPPTKVIS